MTYQVDVFAPNGARAGSLGRFGNIAAARQAMLNHSDTVDLPAEDPFHCPSLGVVEGWFIGRVEYNILQV